MTLYEKLTELMDFAELDGTEWGEMLLSVNALYSCRSIISEELAIALDNEISSQHEWAVNNLEIVEETETITRTTKRLEILE